MRFEEYKTLHKEFGDIYWFRKMLFVRDETMEERDRGLLDFLESKTEYWDKSKQKAYYF